MTDYLFRLSRRDGKLNHSKNISFKFLYKQFVCEKI